MEEKQGKESEVRRVAKKTETDKSKRYFYRWI